MQNGMDLSSIAFYKVEPSRDETAKQRKERLNKIVYRGDLARELMRGEAWRHFLAEMQGYLNFCHEGLMAEKSADEYRGTVKAVAYISCLPAQWADEGERATADLLGIDEEQDDG